jgi:hypothetical protein
MHSEVQLIFLRQFAERGCLGEDKCVRLVDGFEECVSLSGLETHEIAGRLAALTCSSTFLWAQWFETGAGGKYISMERLRMTEMRGSESAGRQSTRTSKKNIYG